MKVLVLHGFRTNKEIMRYQTSHITKTSPNTNTFTHINAPHPTNKTYPEIKYFFPNESTYYEWFERCDDELVGIKQSINYLEGLLPRYDAVLAFSQGCSILSCCNESLLQDKKIVLIAHASVSQPHPSLRCCFLIGTKDPMRRTIEQVGSNYPKAFVHYYDADHRIPFDTKTVNLIHDWFVTIGS